MKGKKINTEFVTQYILNCVNNGISSSEDILIFAEKEIKIIDSKIKEVENLKKERSKIIDVIFTLNKDKVKDIQNINFFKIKDIEKAINICENIGKWPIDLNDSLIKDLISLKILSNNVLQKSKIEKGKLFNEFILYVKNMY